MSELQASRWAARSTALDPSTPSEVTVGTMSVEERLRAEDWGVIRAGLTSYVWRRMGWAPEHQEDAMDIAQETIARAFRREGGWDPDKQPLRRFLENQAAGMAINHLRLFRTRYEVPLIDDNERDADRDLLAAHSEVPIVRHESDEGRIGSFQEPPDEVFDRRRDAGRLEALLTARLASDEVAMAVFGMMRDGVDGAVEQAEN